SRPPARERRRDRETRPSILASMETAASPQGARGWPHELMASVFPRWSNTAFRLAIAAVFLGGAAAVAAPMIYVRSDWNTGKNVPVQQPVQFDHRHHVQDDAIDCRFCHSTVERAGNAGMPSTALCMGCHSQIWN